MKLLLSAILVLALLAVGSMDYDDAVAADTHYCEMVARGYWPNYEQRSCK